MLDLETRIAEAHKDTDLLRKALIKEALTEYTRTLATGDPAAASSHKTAVTRTRGMLKKQLISPAWLALLRKDGDVDDHWIGTTALSFEYLVGPLQIPAPALRTGPRAVGMALAAMMGAVLGMLAATPLTRWTLDMRDLGIVVGGPLGAFLLVLIAWRGSRMRLVRATLRLLTGRARSGPRIDWQAQERVARSAIEQWLDAAVALLTVLCVDASILTRAQADREKVLRTLSRKIYDLHQANQEVLAVTADELIQAARNLGFEGLDGSPVFLAGSGEQREQICWKSSLTGHYEVFGHIADGDQVWVERKPVVLNGKVMERGLVRKVRE